MGLSRPSGSPQCSSPASSFSGHRGANDIGARHRRGGRPRLVEYLGMARPTADRPSSSTPCHRHSIRTGAKPRIGRWRLKSPASGCAPHHQRRGRDRDGVAGYLQSRIVERCLRSHSSLQGSRLTTTCFFGCYVPWSFPRDRGRWTDGLGRVEFLRHQSGRQWPPVDRRPAAHLDSRPWHRAGLGVARAGARVADAAGRVACCGRPAGWASASPTS